MKSESSKQEGKELDEFGHHTFWKFCPGCGKEWCKEEGDDQFGCSSCGYVKATPQPPDATGEAEDKLWEEVHEIIMHHYHNHSYPLQAIRELELKFRITKTKTNE